MFGVRKHLRNLYRMKMRGTRKGFLRLDMNEGIPGLPEEFINRVFKRFTREGISAYPEYTEIERKIGVQNGLKAENVLVTNGSDGAIKHLFEAFVSPGEKVVYTDPTFAMYPVYCSLFRARGQAVLYGPDFAFPTARFLKAVKKGCRMAVVVNPNNPTGSVVGRDQLQEIARACRKQEALLVIDEAYFYFYPQSAADMVKRYKNVCILRTFSKLCGMAGLRLGFCLADAVIIGGLRKVRPTFDVNGVAVSFAEALLDSPRTLKSLIRQTNQGKKYLMAELAKRDIEVRDCRGNFILIRCPAKTGVLSKRLSDRKVLVGSGFKQEFLKDYLRVTIGAVPQMKRFLGAFLSAIGEK